MVTHDLRMVRYVDKVIQMVDGRVVRVIEDPADIAAMAGRGVFAPEPQPVAEPVAFPIPVMAPVAGD
jgi:hypothetical protein